MQNTKIEAFEKTKNLTAGQTKDAASKKVVSNLSNITIKNPTSE